MRKELFTSRSVLIGAVLALMASGVIGQCICPETASVTKFPTGCDGPVTLNATPPVLGQVVTVFATSPFPNAPLILGISSPPGPPLSTLGGCAIHLNLADLALFGGFMTNSMGAFTIDMLLSDPSLCGFTRNIQLAIAGPGSPDPGFWLTNAIQTRKGCPGGGSGNGFCSYTQGGFHGTGTPGQIYDNNFLATFPSGVEVGHYDTAGGNAVPNGLRWQGTAAGQAALKEFLPGGGPSGPIASDELNPLTSFGGGALAYQTVTLTLNAGFNNAGVIGSMTPGFANLIYIEPGSSLSGLSITQILGVANDALAGLGLPAGYSHGTLVIVVTNLNESFDDCEETDWASAHLFAP